jgi:hypothetical protein
MTCHILSTPNVGTIIALENFTMARSTATLRRSANRTSENLRPVACLAFTSEGEERQVDLHAPRSVRRGGRWVVQLMDLWVASLLPGDVLDLTFEMTTHAAGGVDTRLTAIDALHFSRGFIVPTTRELWWEAAADRALHGRYAQAISVKRKAEPPASVVIPTRPAEPPAPIDAVVGRVRDLLPHVACYPRVSWRFGT